MEIRKQVFSKLTDKVQTMKNDRSRAVIVQAKHGKQQKRFRSLSKNLEKIRRKKKELFFSRIDNFVPNDFGFCEKYIDKEAEKKNEGKDEKEGNKDKRGFGEEESVTESKMRILGLTTIADGRFPLDSDQSCFALQSHQTRLFDSSYNSRTFKSNANPEE